MEYLDIINEKDEVIGTASMEEAHQQKLPHRIVHIFIFNKENKMALQLRSQYKSFCPNHWCTPVGGHVRAGETYEQAAFRECKEELGVKLEITSTHKDIYEDGLGNKLFLTTYKAITDGPFNINPEEVQKVEFFTLEQIQSMINSGEKFHPELLFLLKKHFGIK